MSGLGRLVRWRVAVVAFALLAAIFLPARAALPINFSTTGDPTQTYILLQGNQAEFSGSYVQVGTGVTETLTLNSHGLSPSIQLSTIQNGTINVTEFVSGVIYASVGGPLGTTAAPAPTNPGDPGYNLQWQAVAEITYSGNPADSGDITSIQFFALPSLVQVIGNNKVQQSAGFFVSTATLENEIAELSSTPSVDVIKSTKGNNVGQIVRVLAPNQFGGTKDTEGTKYYTVGGFPTFGAYVHAQYLSGATVQINEKLNGVSYSFTGTADASDAIIVSGVYSGVTYTITLQPDAPLTDGSGLTNYIQTWNIYSCPGAGDGIVTTGSDGTSSTAGNSSLPTNVQTQILHDLWCGYNFGFVGSTVIDPVTKVAFGTEATSVWFKDATPATLYAGLQPSHPYYNQYAALINSASNGSAYGFPYADAVPGVTLFDVSVPGSPAVPVTAWNIIIGDQSTPSNTPTMPAWALIFCGAALFGAGWWTMRPLRGAV
jgi:hypothetical protein